MQIFHPLATIKGGLCGRVANALEQRFGLNRRSCAQQFGKQTRLIEAALSFSGRMQRDRDNKVEPTIANPGIVQGCAQPTSHEMTQINLATVLKIVNDPADDPPTAIGGDGRVEMNCAMSAVGATKRPDNSALERLRAFLAKRGTDANSFRSALIAEMLTGSNVRRADYADRWIKERCDCT